VIATIIAPKWLSDPEITGQSFLSSFPEIHSPTTGKVFISKVQGYIFNRDTSRRAIQHSGALNRRDVRRDLVLRILWSALKVDKGPSFVPFSSQFFSVASIPTMAEKTGHSSGLDEKAPEYDAAHRRSAERKGSVVDAAVLQGEIFDERYETTQRGK
jgi:hypothetical protein